jgi:hypothetical protein
MSSSPALAWISTPLMVTETVLVSLWTCGHQPTSRVLSAALIGAALTGMASRLVILASYSWRNRRIVEVMGATDDGPSGQMVVCFGGNGTASRPWTGRLRPGTGLG